MCGTWRHGNRKLNLAHDLKRGCSTITISANESSLSIHGQITAQCQNSSVIELGPSPEARERPFCVYWEPLLDHVWVEVNGKNHTLCWSSGLQGNCCTNLSHGSNKGTATYGILNATQQDDIISYQIQPAYGFFGNMINCSKQAFELSCQLYCLMRKSPLISYCLSKYILGVLYSLENINTRLFLNGFFAFQKTSFVMRRVRDLVIR